MYTYTDSKQELVQTHSCIRGARTIHEMTHTENVCMPVKLSALLNYCTMYVHV